MFGGMPKAVVAVRSRQDAASASAPLALVVRHLVRGTWLALLAALVVAASARAGAYHVYACLTPAGEPAPTDGWSASTGGSRVVVADTCGSPEGALLAALPQAKRDVNQETATWSFAAPSGETIAAAKLWRAGDADGGVGLNAWYEIWFAGPENDLAVPGDNFGQCQGGSLCPAGVGEIGQPLSAPNLLSVPAANLGAHLFMNASCVGISGAEYACPETKADTNGYAAAVYLYAADVTLEQSAGPTAGDVSGELASAPSVQGTSDLAFNASDPGSGVYEAIFSVDGQVVQRSLLDERGGRCRDVGQTSDGLPAFLYVEPCPASLSADVGLDTTRLSNGPHHLVVSVIDAAGNATTVLDREIVVENPATPCGRTVTGSPAAASLTVAWKDARGERLLSKFGRSNTAVGRLMTAAGAPIAGADVQVVWTSALAGAAAVTAATPVTRPNGTFAVHVPAGLPSRELCFVYRGWAGGEALATRTLSLDVRAGIHLTISPRTANIGHTIHFSGRLLGGPIPADGKQLILEARSPGTPWLEFDVVRTDARGRFHAGYTFKFPGPARYQFRVVSEPESDYPYARGGSNAVGVFER